MDKSKLVRQINQAINGENRVYYREKFNGVALRVMKARTWRTVLQVQTPCGWEDVASTGCIYDTEGTTHYKGG
jgi:hypothetical protein